MGLPCVDAGAITRPDFAVVDARIERLGALWTELSCMVGECSSSGVSECRVIELKSDHGEYHGHDH